jgi:hypothetical protein
MNGYNNTPKNQNKEENNLNAKPDANCSKLYKYKCMNKIFLLSASLLLFSLQQATAQGCSDAGFCTIGGLAHETETAAKHGGNSLKLLLPIGLGDEDVFVFAPGLEYTHTLRNWQWQGRITGNYATGNLGSASGAGDIFLSATYSLPTATNLKPAFTLGAKLPLNQSNLKEDGRSLPMQYQSSLGTVDLIAGVSFTWNRWKWAAGWQEPLTGRNRNNFLPVYWNDGKAAAYPPGNDFNRKGDVLLRTNYILVKKQTITLEGGLLGIYHLGEDTYINANESANPIPITGSKGLTLNLTAAADVQLNQKWSLGITAGVPLVVRDIRPDGLTRSFVLAPQLIYHF